MISHRLEMQEEENFQEALRLSDLNERNIARMTIENNDASNILN